MNARIHVHVWEMPRIPDPWAGSPYDRRDGRDPVRVERSGRRRAQRHDEAQTIYKKYVCLYKYMNVKKYACLNKYMNVYVFSNLFNGLQIFDMRVYI